MCPGLSPKPGKPSAPPPIVAPWERRNPTATHPARTRGARRAAAPEAARVRRTEAKRSPQWPDPARLSNGEPAHWPTPPCAGRHLRFQVIWVRLRVRRFGARWTTCSRCSAATSGRPMGGGPAPGAWASADLELARGGPDVHATRQGPCPRTLPDVAAGSAGGGGVPDHSGFAGEPEFFYT